MHLHITNGRFSQVFHAQIETTFLKKEWFRGAASHAELRDIFRGNGSVGIRTEASEIRIACLWFSGAHAIYFDGIRLSHDFDADKPWIRITPQKTHILKIGHLEFQINLKENNE